MRCSLLDSAQVEICLVSQLLAETLAAIQTGTNLVSATPITFCLHVHFASNEFVYIRPTEKCIACMRSLGSSSEVEVTQTRTTHTKLAGAIRCCTSLV